MARLTSLALLFVASTATAYSISTQAKITEENDTPLPVVFWHGLGDNYKAEGLAQIAALADEVNEGTFTYIIRMDEDATAE